MALETSDLETIANMIAGALGRQADGATGKEKAMASTAGIPPQDRRTPPILSAREPVASVLGTGHKFIVGDVATVIKTGEKSLIVGVQGRDLQCMLPDGKSRFCLAEMLEYHCNAFAFEKTCQ